MKLKFGLRLTVWVHYPNGKKKKVIDRQSRSFVLAFLDNLSGSWRDSAHTFPDAGGTNRAYNGNNQIDAGMGNSDYGIVVGNGFTDVLPANYALASRMINGVAGGQMIYPKQAWTPIDSGVASKRSFEVSRYLSNPCAVTQIIRECGLYVKSASSAICFCFVRDLIGAVEVPPRGGIGINYKFEISL